MNKKAKYLSLLALFTFMAGTILAADSWQAELHRQLPLLGHRNWIVVVDSAYPMQTAPGIETICANADELNVVKGVLAELARAKNVKPQIYLDAELKYVAETNAPGISAYRDALEAILAGKPTQRLLHDQIISKLNEAGQTFKILIIKTPQAKPYTSVFFQLECGYWNATAEKQLRDAMQAAQ